MLIKKIKVYELDHNGDSIMAVDMTLKNPIDADEDSIKSEARRLLDVPFGTKKFVVAGEWAFLLEGR